MEVDRELAKIICVTLIHYMKTNQDIQFSNNIVIDMQFLNSWLTTLSPEIISNQSKLLAAVGYNNFCMDVVKIIKFF